MNDTNIKCPNCGENISIDTVLSNQIEQQLKQQYALERKAEKEQLESEKQALAQKSDALKSEKALLDDEINKKVASKIQEEKQNLSKEIRIEVEKEQQLKTTNLQEQLDRKSNELKKAQLYEIELRKEKNKLAEEKEAFELEKLRQLDELKKEISEDAAKKAEEKQQNVIAQLRKQLTDATKAKDELARKLEQGSQQTQGEVLELALEDTLRAEFPLDQIEPVPKGVTGADIVQKVNSNQGKQCGQIIWEIKQTKSWQEGWIQKLKDDQRHIKADIAVIVSSVLPKDISGFMFRDGVWICDVNLSCALASALRVNLIAVHRERSMLSGKNEKMDYLYSYLTGVEFKQRVEAIVEAFTQMQETLHKERRTYEKLWSQREQQIRKVITNTAGMYGDLSGMVTLPYVRSLELDIENEDA